MRRYLGYPSPVRLNFVGQLLNKDAPTRIKDGAVEACFGLYILARVLLCPLGRARHVLDLQMLHHHLAVAISILVGKLVQHVVPLPAHLSHQTGYSTVSFVSVFGPLVFVAGAAFGAVQPVFGGFQVSRVLENSAVRISHNLGHTAVDSDSGFDRQAGVFDFEHARDRRKPLVSIPLDRAGLGRAFDRPVQHDRYSPEFREYQRVVLNTEKLTMRLADAQHRAALLFPTRLATQLLEAPLPSFVQLGKELSTDISRHVSQPGKVGAKLFQLVDLVESAKIRPQVPRQPKGHQPLFMRNIPKESQGILPSQQTRLLLRAGVNAVSICPAYLHADPYMAGVRQFFEVSLRAWPPFLPALKGGVSRSV